MDGVKPLFAISGGSDIAESWVQEAGILESVDVNRTDRTAPALAWRRCGDAPAGSLSVKEVHLAFAAVDGVIPDRASIEEQKGDSPAESPSNNTMVIYLDLRIRRRSPQQLSALVPPRYLT